MPQRRWWVFCGLALLALSRCPAFLTGRRLRVARRALGEAALREELSGLRAREIKRQLDEMRISSAGAVEKAELLEILVRARLAAAPTEAPAAAPAGPEPPQEESATGGEKESIPGVVYKRRLLQDSAATEQLNAEILQLASHLRETDAEGRAWCKLRNNYVGGYTSYGTLSGRTLHQSKPAIQALERHLVPHVTAFYKELLLASDQELQWMQEMRPKDEPWSLRDSWVNILSEGGQHELHEHADSIISGTYYVQTPEDCPGLCFEDPKVSSTGEVEFPVAAGDVILFPGQVWHRVPQNFGNDDRIGISFNYKFDKD